jgi:hypothetical protein
MKPVTDTSLFFRRYLTQMLRNPVWLAVGFVTPVLYLVLFTPLLKQVTGVRGCPAATSSTCSCRASSPCSPTPADPARDLR